MSDPAKFIDDFSPEYAAAEALYLRPGLCVFVGKRQRGGRTDVMAGSPRVPWFRAVSCVGGNHAERAAGFVATYRSRSRALNQVRKHAGVCAVPGADDAGAPWACD